MSKNIILNLLLLSLLLLSCKNEQTQPLTNQETLSEETQNQEVADIDSEENFTEVRLKSSADGYWKRTSYYQSANEKEYYYHPRVQLTDKGKVFYFFGLKGDSKAYLYMLDESKKISIIDTLPINNDVNDFIARQYTNLVIKDGTLYYYKELDNTQGNKMIIPQKEYYSYNLKQRNLPTKINSPNILNKPNRITYNTSTHATFSEKTDYVALFDTYNINIIKKSSWEQINKDSLRIDLLGQVINNRQNQVLISVNEFPPFKTEYNHTDPCIPGFAGVHWDDLSENLYFDNSGPCYACIWKLDIKSKKVSKIVPEHEAIHPFHYTQNKQTYIAYAYKGHIQIAEPVEQIEAIPLEITSFNPNEYKLFYNPENFLEAVSIYNKKDHVNIRLPKGKYFIGSEESGIEFQFSINSDHKITGNYHYTSTGSYQKEDRRYKGEYEIKLLHFKIQDSKIISEHLQFEDSNSLYTYNHIDNTAIEKSFTLDNKLKSTTNYSIEFSEYEGVYLKRIATTYYNSNGTIEKIKDYVNNKTAFYNDAGAIQNVEEHIDNKINVYNNTGVLTKQIDNESEITYLLDNDQTPTHAILNDRYILLTPTADTLIWTVVHKDNSEKSLPLKKNITYTINYNENKFAKFQTNSKGLIEGTIIEKNNNEIETISEVSNSVIKTWKKYRKNKLIVDSYYNAKDSVFFAKYYIQKDSVIKKHTTIFLDKKNKYKKITKVFYKSGNYKIIDEIKNKEYLYDTRGNKTSIYTENNITYNKIYKKDKLYKRTYTNAEGSVTEYFKKEKMYRKEIAYTNSNGVLFLKLYNGKNQLVKNVKMPLKNNKPNPKKIKL